MAEYIKKTDVMSDAMCTGIACRECSFDSDDGCKIAKFFSELPTIDIVTCGECIGKGYPHCKVLDDWYCADGERRTDG